MAGIVIIGPRSVGKSTIGRVLAKKLNCPYYDSDELVEQQMGDWNAFAKKHGSNAVRREERTIIRKLISTLPDKFVISVGGGTIASQFEKESEANVVDLKKKATIVYLAASDSLQKSLDLLEKRELQRKGDQDRKEIEKLYKLRTPIYEKVCDIKIVVEEKSLEKVVADIQTALRL
ncbi:MAG TPA: shikimate kinase [Candidatus Nanoarchaeia archaeon]|nr:shikimate kinase [Candidatus Nanoarchaeia archaeon]